MTDQVTAVPDRDRPKQDLRASLLREGIALARSGGAEAVSLREVQRRAGVSNSAAYRHFADRAALLSAISDYAADQMAERMRTGIAAAAISGDPAERARARFCATGVAYLEFALTESGLFAVAFQMQAATVPTPLDRTTQSPPFALLASCLDELVETGSLAPAHRPYADIAAWAAVHGLAVLLLDGPLRDLDAAERQSAIQRLISIVDLGTH